MGIVLLVIVGVVALWAIMAYNRLIALKNKVANGWKQIDVQLKRRHDLIPNLVNAVKGAMDFEKSTLEAVISARNKAVGASGVAQVAKAEGELTQALGRLFALSENYPQLKATANIQQLQEELTAPRTRSASRGSSTTMSRPPTTPRSSSFPPTSWPGWPRRLPPNSGRSRIRESGRCRMSI